MYRWFLYLNSPFVYFLRRQGYPEDFHRANQSAYSEYYADYAKHYDYAGMSHWSIVMNELVHKTPRSSCVYTLYIIV